MGIQEDLTFLEERINELVIKYEQYFLGLEKREPVKLFEDVDRFIRRYNTSTIFNTMYKHKFHTLSAKFNSYKQYWTRTNRLIEEGKYSRDRFKMERHLAEAAPRPPAERTAGKADTSSLETVYQNYLEARRKCNLATENISREQMFSVIEKQREVLKNKHRCNDVEFRVVIEDGAPKLKARPAKSAAKSGNV